MRTEVDVASMAKTNPFSNPSMRSFAVRKQMHHTALSNWIVRRKMRRKRLPSELMPYGLDPYMIPFTMAMITVVMIIKMQYHNPLHPPDASPSQAGSSDSASPGLRHVQHNS